MNLEEMKNLWQQQNEELKQNRILNEKIISNMIRNRSLDAIRRMTGTEYLGASVCALLIVIFVLMATHVQPGAILACYILSLFFIGSSLALSIYKISYLSKTNMSSPVTETTQRIRFFRLLIARERLGSLLLFPFIITCILAVVNYWVHDTNIFEHMDIYLPRIIIALVAGIPAMLVIYKKVYANSIQQINSSLKELEEFSR